MRVKVQKWGNSIALRIPRSFAVECSLQDGSIVNLSLRDGKLVIEPLAPNEYTLATLVSQVNESNVHQEYPTGKPMGVEPW
ncbi:MAG: Antitoxin MazE [Firmicutes bacterium]|nr:Antitoxin MazE [candidate division NPL-UPA2 bacterium]